MTVNSRGASAWWQREVIYQIYPRLFQDTDGDGVGDLDGIGRRLDYLAWLGVDGLWVSPIYPSPWPTSATTSPTTATSTRFLAHWPGSTAL